MAGTGRTGPAEAAAALGLGSYHGPFGLMTGIRRPVVVRAAAGARSWSQRAAGQLAVGGAVRVSSLSSRSASRYRVMICSPWGWGIWACQ